jgi:ubiquinone/menaquinone biosynthesis C-methylase UbiE
MTSPTTWEAAYLRFETPAEERRKFIKRLEQLGARSWPSDSVILELCCGRGSGLLALEHLGFGRIEGIDISSELLGRYEGDAACYVADCRALPFGEATKDAVVVHGGLHHLLDLPGDLRKTVAEVHRVLKPGGRFVLVEPWLTPFLRVVHVATERRKLRRLWPKLDALGIMIDHERATYESWLGQPDAIRAIVTERLHTESESTALGKWSYVGRK